MNSSPPLSNALDSTTCGVNIYGELPHARTFNNRAPHTVLVLFCIVGLLGCTEKRALREWKPSDHGQPSSSPGTEDRVPAESKEVTEARAVAVLWEVSCATCHGLEGHGNGPGKMPAMSIPDFTTGEWQTSHTDADITAIVTKGQGMMPPFGERIRPDGIGALVKHIRSFSPIRGQ